MKRKQANNNKNNFVALDHIQSYIEIYARLPQNAYANEAFLATPLTARQTLSSHCPRKTQQQGTSPV